MATPAQPAQVVLPVSELIRRAARTLEASFGEVWVEGEIDSFKRHQASGHLYFALKDAGGRVEAMMPRLRAQRVRFPLSDGLTVRARGRISLYEPQGRFQFYIEDLELTGEGELLRAFEALKARLLAEGLLARERKRPLPPFPRRVGLVTSPSGAALYDILRVAARRGRVNLLIAPCPVQGDGAPPQIAAAIALLQRYVDVIIVGRGGGSSADLWCFNDEALARAIAKSRVPVVSAIGHEVDYTIADFVADLRAPTPSAAAELVIPLFSRLEEELADCQKRMSRAGGRILDQARQRLDSEVAQGAAAVLRRLQGERRLLAGIKAQLDTLHPRARLSRDREALTGVTGRLLGPLHPRTRLSRDREALAQLAARLERAALGAVTSRHRQFEGLTGRLDAMSPLHILARGFAVAQDPEGHVLTDASGVRPGDRVHVRLSRGELRCEVREVQPGPAPAAPAPAAPAGSTPDPAGGR